ncbi:hypothetical protein [Natrononativus amylolyticus]|uniref:hypothetical protein n=1 Tax=Natrononativus amylolyticus TaxID=2963434 RepID=UPI0020CC8D58|nr:hypothetical protein [Natrononativus amylolyticus]
MSETTLEEVEAALERASELDDEAAADLLRDARARLERLESVDDERREALTDRIDQRLREIDQRDAYDGDLGAAMNPENDDAP